jgi:hypothetical protein
MTTIANDHLSTLSEQRAYLHALRTSGTLPSDRPRPSFGALERTISLIEDVVRKSNGNIRAIDRTIVALASKNTALAALIEARAAQDTMGEFVSIDDGVPPLQPATKANEAHAYEASPILDAMIEFFKYWCTRSYEGYHEAVALWVLSTIAARRVYLPWRKGVWTPLYIMLLSDSTTHAKTEAASYGSRIIEDCHLQYLLCPDETSPQKLLHNMAGRSLPRNYSAMKDAKKEDQRLKLAFSGQRGWLYDEFGNKLQEIVKGKGYNAPFYALLKQLYDCKRAYEYDTLTRDNEHIDMSYLSIIGTATPACLKSIASKDSALWTDGTFARIAFVVPPKTEIKLQSAPLEECVVPQRIIETLQDWHYRLGIPDCDVVDTELLEAAGEENQIKSKDGPRYEIIKGELPQQHVSMTHAVYKAHELYYQSLALLAQEHNLDERFRASYGRLPDMALRIAMLLASLENAGNMDMRHWGRGQAIAERWRHDFHELIAQISGEDTGGYGEIEQLVLDALTKMGRMATSRDVAQRNVTLRKLGSPEVRKVLEELAEVRVIHKEGYGRGALYGVKRETQ